MSRIDFTPVSGSLFQTPSWIVTFRGTEYVMPRSWHSWTSYFNRRPTVSPHTSQTAPRTSFATPHDRQTTSRAP